MTDQKQEPPQERQPTTVTVAQPGSRLEQLLAQYGTAKAEAEEAALRFKAITTALKAETSAACPGAEDIALSGAPNLPKLRLSWRRPWRFNTDRFKEEQPYLYVKYSEQGGHWELRAMQ